MTDLAKSVIIVCPGDEAMEFIVQLFRALANRERIRILRLLAVLGEMRVSSIAEAMKIALSPTSAHLKVLASAGLVWRRRSGCVVNCHLAARAGNPVTTAALRAVKKAFRSVTQDDPGEVAQADLTDSPTGSDAALFACFTGFTHPRRLQIIRHLARQGKAPLPELAAGLSMSQRACLRHLSKLERRGLVGRKPDGRRSVYTLTEGHGPISRALLVAVSEYLRTGRQ